jgi:hypothetical protein
MSNSSVPQPTLGQTGFVAPSEDTILAAVQSDMSQAFGGNLNPALNTPQGQLASSLTAIIGDKNDLFAQIVNQVDPQYATGRMQDAIAHIYFLERKAAVPTAVSATVTGLPGTVIPVNAQAKATDGSIYVCTGAVTIPVGGSIVANFAAVVPGPTACPAGALNAINVAIPGWDTITNATSGVPGSLVESATDFAYRMAQSVAANARGTLQAIQAALFNVTNVIDVYCTENVTDSPVTISGQTLAPHSLWAAVAGGTSADIAAAIWSKKSLGCNYNGNNPTVVYDNVNYQLPYPQYTVNWWTATPTPILFAVNIANSANLPANVVASIKAAIVSAFAGGDGGQVARIGSTISASRFYAPILALAVPGTAIQINSVKLGIASATLDAVTMGIDQIPTITAANIAVNLV